MVDNGKWEARIVIPTGNWTFDITESGGGGASATITLTGGNTYYVSSAGNDSVDLAARIAERIGASALNATYTVTVSAGEGGTGKYTITCQPGVSGVTSFAITWTSSAARDVLGWSADLSGALTYTSPKAAGGLWLPDHPPMKESPLTSSGLKRYQMVVTVGGTGAYRATQFGNRTEDRFEYNGQSGAKSRTALESTTGESWEQFYDDAIAGNAVWAQAGYLLRWYKDADTDGTYVTYNYRNGSGVPLIERQVMQVSSLYQVVIPVVLEPA